MNIDMKKAAQNYSNLSDQEKEIVREAVDSPLMGILSKVFGDEFVSALGTFQRPQRKINAEMQQQVANMLMR